MSLPSELESENNFFQGSQPLGPGESLPAKTASSGKQESNRLLWDRNPNTYNLILDDLDLKVTLTSDDLDLDDHIDAIRIWFPTVRTINFTK